MKLVSCSLAFVAASLLSGCAVHAEICGPVKTAAEAYSAAIDALPMEALEDDGVYGRVEEAARRLSVAYDACYPDQAR